jgi:iron complex outermembrane receptor protein
VAWSPRDWVTLRAGYERTFSIPVASFETVRLESFLSVGQNDFLPRTIRFGTGLAPETSDNLELGAVLRPIPNLVVDLNYYRFELHGLVGTESLSASELLRDPATGRLIGAISELINGPDVETDGVDFSARYNWDMLGGRFIATVDGIYLNKYDLLIPATATAPARVYTAAGFYNTRSGGPQGSPIVLGSFPEWKVNVGLTFERGIHSLTGLMRYISDYDIHPSAGGANNCCRIPKIDQDVRFDLFYNARLFNERTRLSLSILNLTDEDPPLAPAGARLRHLDAQLHDADDQGVPVAAVRR